jgi:hypothetical protein
MASIEKTCVGCYFTDVAKFFGNLLESHGLETL